MSLTVKKGIAGRPSLSRAAAALAGALWVVGLLVGGVELSAHAGFSFISTQLLGVDRSTVA